MTTVQRLVTLPFVPLVYLVAITIAEMLTTMVEPRLGIIAHGLVLIVLLIHAALAPERVLCNFLLALALAPLIRILSLAIPLPSFPFVYWYALVGAPLLMAVYIVYRTAGLTRAEVGLTWGKLPAQLAVSVTGLGLGYLEYQILRPAPAIPEWNVEQLILPALILLIFTGFLEEILFRGVMQRTARDMLGLAGVVYVALIFAVLHLGYHSALDVIFVFAVGMFFGLIVLQTGSIFGVTLAHGLTNITLFLVYPLLLK